MSSKSRISCAVLASAALAAGTLGLSPTATAAASGHQLPGSVPSWATASHKAGSANAKTTVDFRVYLEPRGGDAAAQYALAASTPGNKAYHHFLTPAQFNARYAPSTSTVDAVKSWLRSQGFKVGVVPSNRRYVEAIGTVGQAAAAFQTSFANYHVQGKTLRSNTRPLTVPSSLKGVSGVVGLDESMALVHTDATPPGGFRNARPCATYWGDTTVATDPAPHGQQLPTDYPDYAPCGYTPDQLQGAYGMAGAIGSGNDGSGVRVAIIDAYASPTILQDANEYSSRHGLPSLNGLFSQHVAPGTYVRPQNPRQDPQGWSGEETLDVEAVHTMAPGASILYVGSPNNYQDMDAAMNWVVSRHAADIVTNSYGWNGEALPRGVIKPLNDILVQAAAEGISEFFSSGDNGDETGGSTALANQATPDWPASDPWVTAVGGTSMGVLAGNTRGWELGWQTHKLTLQTSPLAWVDTVGYLYGAGGGTSRLFTEPSYQQGVVPTDMAMGSTSGGRAQPMRVVPDVAALADPTTGMLVGQTQTFPDGTYYDEYRIGGTSLASPLYAGMFALAEQKAGHEYGLANPVLYGTRAASIDITKNDRAAYPGDVRSDYVNGVDASNGYRYSARYFDADEQLTIHVRPGYDDVTGVGVPNGQAWLDAVAAQ